MDNSLIDLLIRLGHRPVWRRGDKALFHSPFRRDNHPSFSVFLSASGRWRWKGFATGEGGTEKDLLEKLGVDSGNWKEDREWEKEIRRLEWEARLEKRKEARAFYEDLLRNQTEGDRKALAEWFSSLGLPLPKRAGAVFHIDWREKVRYVCFPCPTPRSVHGVEMREMKLEKGKKRKTKGEKTFWIMRGGDTLLITESIMDALAGLAIFPRRDLTLLALNGAANANRVGWAIDLLKPKLVWIATDADKAGEEAAHLVRVWCRYRKITWERVYPQQGKDLLESFLLREEEKKKERERERKTG